MSFVPRYFYFSSGKSLFVGEPPKSTSVFLGPGVDMIKEAMFVYSWCSVTLLSSVMHHLEFVSSLRSSFAGVACEVSKGAV